MLAVTHGWTASFHAMGNWLYTFFGVGGSGPNYGFWSGTGSDIGEVTIIGGVYMLWRRHNCGVKRCWRIGHRTVPGTDHVACRRHHPVPQPTYTDLLAQHHAGMEARRQSDRKLDEIHRHVSALAPDAGTFPPPAA